MTCGPPSPAEEAWAILAENPRLVPGVILRRFAHHLPALTAGGVVARSAVPGDVAADAAREAVVHVHRSVAAWVRSGRPVAWTTYAVLGYRAWYSGVVRGAQAECRGGAGRGGGAAPGVPPPVDGEMALEVADPRGRTPDDLAADADERAARAAAVSRLLTALPPRDRAVVATYFGLPGGRRVRGGRRTHAAVGKAFGLSKNRTMQIVRAALDRMRAAATDADRAA